MARLLHGRPLAEKLKDETRTRAEALRARGVHPGLAVVSVGADPAALTYAERLARTGRSEGVDVRSVALPKEAREGDLRTSLDELGRDRAIH